VYCIIYEAIRINNDMNVETNVAVGRAIVSNMPTLEEAAFDRDFLVAKRRGLNGKANTSNWWSKKWKKHVCRK
jgi:hypothetical protein